MKNMVVLVKDNGGEGEIVAVFEEFWEALQAAQSLNSPYRIYVKSFSTDECEVEGPNNSQKPKEG